MSESLGTRHTRADKCMNIIYKSYELLKAVQFFYPTLYECL